MVAPITPQNVQSPQSVTRKRRLAEALMQQGTDTSPVGHPLGALARALQGGMAGYMSHKADTAEREGMEGYKSRLAGVLAGNKTPDIATSLDLASDPWASEGTSSLLGVMMKQQLENQTPKTTDDMAEYDWAVKHGYKGTPADWMTRGRPVNVGTIPAGHELYSDPVTGKSSMRMIEGSPEWLEAQAKQKQDAQAQQQQATTANIVTEDVNRAIDMVKTDPAMTTGLIGQYLKDWGGSKAHDLHNLISTVKANIGFDQLSKMRTASPTGAALGNVTVQEIEYLQATIGALAQSQSAEQLAYNLKRVNEVFLDTIHGPGNRPEVAQQQQAPSAEDPLGIR
jgi:hypothetical protein